MIASKNLRTKLLPNGVLAACLAFSCVVLFDRDNAAPAQEDPFGAPPALPNAGTAGTPERPIVATIPAAIANLGRARRDLSQDASNVAAAKEIRESLQTLRQNPPMLAGALCSLARASYQLGDSPKAKRDLQEAEGAVVRWDQQASGVWLLKICYEHLLGGNVEEGLRVLATIVDRPLPIPDTPIAASVGELLHRRLDAMPSDQRYEVLSQWSMANGKLRDFSVRCSTVEAPRVFARALGKRPKTGFFAVPDVGNQRGLFSTSWELAVAAREEAQLRAWKSKLDIMLKDADEPTDEQTKSAEAIALIHWKQNPIAIARYARQLATLAADAREINDAERESLDQYLASQAASLDALNTVTVFAAENNMTVRKTMLRVDNGILTGAEPSIESLLASAAVLSAACGLHEDLASQRDALIAAAASKSESFEASLPTRMAAAQESEKLPLLAAPQHWIVAQRPGAIHQDRKDAGAIWVQRDDQIGHVPGAQPTALLLKYPLEGDFQWRVRASAVRPRGGNLSAGSVTAGGTGSLLAYGRLTIMQSIFGRSDNSISRSSFNNIEREPHFHLFDVKHASDTTSISINGHLITSYPTTSPWIGLMSDGPEMTAFRSIQITGSPRIAREVRLSDDENLAGWYSNGYGNTQPTSIRMVPRPQPVQPSPIGGFFRSIFQTKPAEPPQPPEPTVDWSYQNGEIRGRRAAPTAFGLAEPTATANWIAYLRPLDSEESVQYEFFYEPDKFAVHPTYGPIAMLVRPNGVQLRWLAESNYDGTGLGFHNAVTDILSRRGPKPLPLKSAQWNQAKLSRKNDRLSLQLNGVEILSMKAGDNPQPFGFYHDRAVTAAKIRNVVLSGNWPEQLPDALLPSQSKIVAKKLRRIIPDALFSENAVEVCFAAKDMSDEQKYQLLSEWVLPNDSHGLRLAGGFTPLHPVPGYEDGDPIDAARLKHAKEKGLRRVAIGGNLVAPAIELLAVARRLGKLDEVRLGVNRAEDQTDFQKRSKLAMSAMIAIAQADSNEAKRQMEALLPLVVIEQPEGGRAALRGARHLRWPDVLAVHVGLRFPATRPTADAMIQHMFGVQNRSWGWEGGEAFYRHVQHLSTVASTLEQYGSLANAYAHVTGQWKSVCDVRARSRGQGNSRDAWRFGEIGLEKYSPSRQSAVYFDVPLEGNYEINAELPIFSWRETRLSAGGSWTNMHYTLKKVRYGDIRREQLMAAPEFERPKYRFHYRATVQDGVKTNYINGRQVRQVTLHPNASPWVYASSGNNQLGRLMEVRISGNPVIPDEIKLLNPLMDGWVAYFEFHPLNEPGVSWSCLGDQLRGMRNAVGGDHEENLLMVHRPMLEDGTIQYEFYYDEQTQTVVHPAMDRLTFMVKKDGIQEHWVTDGRYDQHGIDPANLSTKSECQLTKQLPLKQQAWNTMFVRLEKDTVTLTLNGTDVYRRELEITNQRNFGLFYYLDHEQALVQNIRWKGDWPKQLPAPKDQVLWHAKGKELPQDSSHLKAVYSHKFSDKTYPDDEFTALNARNGDITGTENGVHVKLTTPLGWTHQGLKSGLRLKGDFDVTARFEGFREDLASKGATGVALTVQVPHKEPDKFDTFELQARRVHALQQSGNKDEQKISAATHAERGDDEQRTYPAQMVHESTSGRVRVQRRGTTLYASFADRDSEQFQFLWKAEAGDGPTIAEGIRIFVFTMGENTTVEATWKDIEVRAEAFLDE